MPGQRYLLWHPRRTVSYSIEYILFSRLRETSAGGERRPGGVIHATSEIKYALLSRSKQIPSFVS